MVTTIQNCSYETTFEICGREFDCEVGFSYTPSVPEEGPSYASGGQPGEEASIEIESIDLYPLEAAKITGEVLAGTTRVQKAWVRGEKIADVPQWLTDLIEKNLMDNHFADMEEQALPEPPED